MSHGRGGAGNIGKVDRRESYGAEELVTPTIKSNLYTTGRGGSGNMAKNDPLKPEVARAAQDVQPVQAREPEGNFHIGRGGAANIVKPSEEEVHHAKKNNNNRRSNEVAREEGYVADDKEDSKGLGEKAKDLLAKVGLKN
ncbi:hypothetical protein K490DRAFT_62157 [Saccharata proteae CBS 121410]|uniref:Uncharacterized protein n=1 Tax=Saccharata proteae CBS 121410 TaxID=1314787 RepID=A0A9P4HX30_9PEZI|nr:hypothetical protein K490DRAFT_62157 [Saccharata proteae CBS 121410]